MEKIVGVILAGGRSSRMQGKDKSFLRLSEKTLIERAIGKAKLQVADLLISTISSDPRYQDLKLPLVADLTPDHAGPLAGVLASMNYVTKNYPAFSYLATFPVDSPFYPENLVAQLLQALQLRDVQIVIPRYRGRAHWVFGVWSLDLAADLHQYLLTERSVQGWVKRQIHCFVDYDDLPTDPFFNINSPSDLESAAQHLNY